ncbi:MAG: AMP-binding protein [Dehalococcoidia bacterium]|nr:AMP-binding protein [Dehalococcoidia bacterium]
MAEASRLESTTVGGILEDKARQNGTKPLIYFKDEVASYEQTNERANRVANWFLSMGFRKGDKVIILLGNCLEWLYVWFGLAKIGVVTVPLNTQHKDSLLQYLINHSDARLMVVGKNLVDRIKPIRGRLTTLTTLVLHPSSSGVLDLGLDTISFPELLHGSPANPESDVEFHDTLTMLYTTDPVGPSQGVVSPHGQYIRCGKERAKLVRITPNDVFASVSPLYHIIPLGDILMTSLLGDAAIVVCDRFSARRFWEDVRRYNITLSGGFGIVMNLLYMQPPKDNDADNSLRQLIIPDAPESIREAFEKRFNVAVTDAYGMTEVDPLTATTIEDRRPGSCGKAADGLEVKVFDDNGNELKPGEIGEIVCRPKRAYVMMREYYKMPDKTIERWRNLWFHTDDYGYQDEDGYFYFVGGKNDAIKWRGENVSAFEVEEIIHSHSSVLEAAVVGIPSELGGHDVKATLQLKEGETMTPGQLIEFCEQRMAFFMIPRYVEFVDRFPRSGAGKVVKSHLKAISEGTWDRERVGYRVKRG